MTRIVTVIVLLSVLLVALSPVTAQGPTPAPPVQHEPDFPKDSQDQRVCDFMEVVRRLDKTYVLVSQMALDLDTVAGYRWTYDSITGGLAAEVDVLYGADGPDNLPEAFIVIPFHVDYWSAMMEVLQFGTDHPNDPLPGVLDQTLAARHSEYTTLTALFVAHYGCDQTPFIDVEPIPAMIDVAEKNLTAEEGVA